MIPEGTSGDWSVEHFTVNEQDIKLFNLRCQFQPGMGRRTMKPGTYQRLRRGRAVIMTDTPAELQDHSWFVWQATGNVLVNGLGLGCVLRDLLAKPEVKRVTVIENSPDVIALVAPHFDDRRLTIIEDDAFTWQPPKGERYQAVWHDIWDTICADNLPEMHRLHRKYGRRCDWQGSWCRELCEMHR